MFAKEPATYNWVTQLKVHDIQHTQHIPNLNFNTEKMQDYAISNSFNRINEFAQNSSGQAQTDIENYKNTYMNRLEDAKKGLLEKDIFEQYKKEKIQEIESDINSEIESFLDDLLSNY